MLNYKVNVYMSKGTRPKTGSTNTTKHLVYTSQFLSHTPVQLLHQLIFNRLTLEQEKNQSLMYTLEVNTVVDQYVIDVRLYSDEAVCATIERGLIELIEREEVRHIPPLEIGKPDFAEFAHLVLHVRPDALRIDRSKMQEIFDRSGVHGKIILQKERIDSREPCHSIQLLIGGSEKSLYSLSHYQLDPLFRKHGLLIQSLNLLPFDLFSIRDKVAMLSSADANRLWIDDISTSKNGRSHQICFKDGQEFMTVICDLHGAIRSYKCS
ncbi:MULTISPECIES: hypothetical protein [Exiguobacterium]|uniref:Uncharacterized protein n=2 Tax=Bacillales Family XII. Incertae Sedis TaxID=539742 RepID=A0ABT6R5H6_9BACL|nr:MULTISPECIES: hypothetical protein [Exiguobacterium]AFS70687.1 Hypothetical protein Eab7_1576 [Exiguobacterium antarcticum B7]MDI3236214.1 hypothetical protein [Exiguobacterium antarcticum]